MIRQRIYGIETGYEDLHDQLRDEPLLAASVRKTDPTGEHRWRKRDPGHSLAAATTLSRLPLTPTDVDGGNR